MARKLPKGAGKSGAGKPAAGKPAGPGELDILHPERVITLAGRTVEVREYGYIEGLKVQAAAQPFIDALYALVSAGSAPPPAHAVRQVFAGQAVIVQWMMGQAVTPTNDADPQAFVEAVRDNADWVGTLDDLEGDALTTVWWGVNAGFFTRRLRELALAAREAPASPSGTDGSTPH